MEQVLQEIGAQDKPVMLALNKVDLVDPEWLDAHAGGRFFPGRSALSRLRDSYPEPVLLSAMQGVGVEDLLAEVEQALVAAMVPVDTVVPYSMGEALHLWHENGLVSELSYGTEGIHIIGLLPRWLAGRLGFVAEEREADTAGDAYASDEADAADGADTTLAPRRR